MCSYHAKMFVGPPLLSLRSLPEKLICITWSRYIMVYKGEKFISCIGTNYKCPGSGTRNMRPRRLGGLPMCPCMFYLVGALDRNSMA
jgi:hypothetical protein